MICYATASLTDCDIQIKADDDAEDRILDIEAVFGIDIKVYRENEISILTDLYSTKDEIIPCLLYTSIYSCGTLDMKEGITNE